MPAYGQKEPRITYTFQMPFIVKQRLDFLTLLAYPRLTDAVRSCLEEGLVLNWYQIPKDHTEVIEQQTGRPFLPPDQWERDVRFMITTEHLAQTYQVDSTHLAALRLLRRALYEPEVNAQVEALYDSLPPEPR